VHVCVDHPRHHGGVAEIDDAGIDAPQSAHTVSRDAIPADQDGLVGGQRAAPAVVQASGTDGDDLGGRREELRRGAGNAALPAAGFRKGHRHEGRRNQGARDHLPHGPLQFRTRRAYDMRAACRRIPL
jgi:hypothetical protein